MKQKINKICILAMLIALFYVMSIMTSITITNSFKITFQNLPLFLGASFFGSLSGIIIGGFGMFLNQLLSQYGLTPTTILWILPYVISGAFVGFFYKRVHNKFLYIVLFSIANVIITIFNTIALYIDSKIFGYYSYALVFSSFIYKLLLGIILGIIYGIIIPNIVYILRKSELHLK